MPVKKSEYIDRVAERKQAYLKIKKAQKYYEKGLGYVNKSLPLLLEAAKLNPNNPELNFNIGACYLQAGPKANALPYLLAAKQAKPNSSEDIYFFIALAYQSENDFSKAIVHYKTTMELLSRKKNKNSINVVERCKKHIAECKFGKQFFEQTSNAKVGLLPAVVNSKYDEFKPILTGQQFYFSSRREGGKARRSLTDQKFLEKVYQLDFSEYEWGEPKEEKLNRMGKSNTAFLTHYGNEQFVAYRGNKGKGDLYVVEKKEETWKTKKRLRSLNSRKSRESSASMPKSADEIYFVSDRKGGFGKNDIYSSKKEANGKWSKPVNIGGKINTEYDEGDVFVTADGSVLYFSSKGHNTMGGYDIFKCERMTDRTWSAPKNMGMPVNSTDNDCNFFASPDEHFFFVSDRSGGNGGFDIYKVDFATPEPQEEEKEEVEMFSVEIPLVPIQDTTQALAEIPVKQELVEEDFVYRVQIAASKKEMTSEDLFKRYKGEDAIEHLYVENWHKYTIGRFLDFETAAKYRDACGVSDAFVVLFKGGYRLGIARKPVGTN